MKKVIMKFGGTSMADADRIRACADFVRQSSGESGRRVVTVVSAMAGVTDALLELAAAAGSGHRAAKYALLADLRKRHEEPAKALGADDAVGQLLDQLDTLVTGISAVGELTPRSCDAVVVFGERLSAALMAAALPGSAMTGQQVGIVTDDNHGEADPLLELSLYQVNETLNLPLQRGEGIVVTGFDAATQHGVTTTLGRGGSDYTATIIGAAVKADEIW
ncbi:MAG: hypothetical protein V3W34_08110, partial [Phycisphaerae bacterium]